MTECALRQCRVCKETKPATSEFFEKSKHCTGGIQYRCKPCCNALRRKWLAENREAVAERWKARYAPNHAKAKKLRDRHYRVNQPIKAKAIQMSNTTRRRSKTRGVECDPLIVNALNLETMLTASPLCPSCGSRFEFRCSQSIVGVLGFPATRRSVTPSLDRLNPSLGYVVGNLAIICWRCNFLKSDGVLSEFEALTSWLRCAMSDECVYDIKEVSHEASDR